MASIQSANISESNYMLPQNEAERQRLNKTYHIIKRFLNREGALPSFIDPKSINNVLDIAAGTLSWTLDLVSTPSIKSRLSPSSKNPIHLYASDLTAAKFPPTDVINSLGIKTFLHDVTTPFPEEFNGKFDIVNMKLLVFGLTGEGWAKTLENVAKVLKPGGWLLLCEIDCHTYTKEEVLAKEFPRTETNPDSWVYPMNELFAEVARLHQYIPNLSTKLPIFVESSHFTIESKVSAPMPMGAICKEAFGVAGQSLKGGEEFTEFAVLYTIDILVGFGLKDRSQEECNKIVDELKRKICKEGIYFFCTDLVARRE